MRDEGQIYQSARSETTIHQVTKVYLGDIKEGRAVLSDRDYHTRRFVVENKDGLKFTIILFADSYAALMNGKGE